jgi:hypothetical protein
MSASLAWSVQLSRFGKDPVADINNKLLGTARLAEVVMVPVTSASLLSLAQPTRARAPTARTANLITRTILGCMEVVPKRAVTKAVAGN